MNPLAPQLPLSLDWEDWYQLCCPPYDAPDAHDCFEDRLSPATDLALELCADLGARATWFCLADQARRHPASLRRIADAGHEIALHGLDHRRAFEQERAEFRLRTAEGRTILEDLTGVAVRGYRAPEWSLRGRASSYGSELASLGFAYDSSRAPLRVLGDPSWPREAHWLADGLAEFPPPVWGWGPCTIPLWGWAARILPESFLRGRLKSLARRRSGNPLVLHPWELDAGQPALPAASRGHRFCHAAGLAGYGARLRRLLAGFHLIPLGEWLDLEPPAREPR